MRQSAKSGTTQEPPPRRRGWPRAAGEDVLAHAAAAMTRAGFSDPTLVLRWAEIAGPGLARVAEPLRWQEGEKGAVLTLKCEAAASVFLQHETRALLERLNAYLGPGRVARIKLMPGTLTLRPPLAPPLPAAALKAEPREPGLAAALERLGRRRVKCPV